MEWRGDGDALTVRVKGAADADVSLMGESNSADGRSQASVGTWSDDEKGQQA
jgi:hypothetical protein